MNALCILASGMVSAVGLSAPASCAAIRCAIDNVQETRFIDRGGEWLIAASVPLEQPWRGRTKLIKMAARAIAEALQSAPGVDPAQVAARLDAIIADLVANGPTEEEVSRVATRYLSSRIQSLEQVNGKANVLAEGQLYAGDPDHYKKELAAYASVTPAEVTAAMQRIYCGTVKLVVLLVEMPRAVSSSRTS